jgi:hypothetical protein
LKLEELRMIDAQEAEMQVLFKEKDNEGNWKAYDRKKKFGTIEEDDQLIYDDITTSYKLNLPTEYYMK